MRIFTSLSSANLAVALSRGAASSNTSGSSSRSNLIFLRKCGWGNWVICWLLYRIGLAFNFHKWLVAQGAVVPPLVVKNSGLFPILEESRTLLPFQWNTERVQTKIQPVKWLLPPDKSLPTTGFFVTRYLTVELLVAFSQNSTFLHSTHLPDFRKIYWWRNADKCTR